MREVLSQLFITPMQYILLELFWAGVMVATALIVSMIVAVIAPISIFFSLIAIMVVD